jgi:hypothetical protein
MLNKGGLPGSFFDGGVRQLADGVVKKNHTNTKRQYLFPSSSQVPNHKTLAIPGMLSCCIPAVKVNQGKTLFFKINKALVPVPATFTSNPLPATN